MKNIKISVIVTIHNAEKYLRECMESVLLQTFADIEILCIDGGSLDMSPQILEEYAVKDERIRIINDPDTSYGHKVNRGIKEARGEYISVLESDDMYEPFMLEKLYEVAEQYSPDFVNADYICFFDVNGKRFQNVTKMYPDKDYNRLMENKKHPEEFGVIPRYWTGIFKKSFLEREKIQMNESPGASYQDMSFRFLTSVLAETSYHLDLPVYLYRIDNPDSSMHDCRKTVVIADEHDFLHHELKKRGIRDKNIWHNAYQWKYLDFRGNMRYLRGAYRQELFQRYQEELKKDQHVLDAYADMGWLKDVAEMISESPQKVLKLIEQESTSIQRYNHCLSIFLNRITSLPKEQNVVLFGCGQKGMAALEYLQAAECRIACLTDNANALWDTAKGGYKILEPKVAVQTYGDAFYVVANKRSADEIMEQLQKMGIPGKMICKY